MLRLLICAGCMALGASAIGQTADYTMDSNFMVQKKPVGGKKAAPVADKEEKKVDPNRLIFGGNMGASFGDFTFINVSPQVGYAFKPWLTAGVGVNFIYNSVKYRDFYGDEVYRQNLGYGGLNVFARVFPVKFIMLSAQPDLNYSWGKTKYKNSTTPDIKLTGAFVPAFILGAGVVVPTGSRGGMIISMQYDVIQNIRSPYGTKPYVNVGFTF